MFRSDIWSHFLDRSLLDLASASCLRMFLVVLVVVLLLLWLEDCLNAIAPVLPEFMGGSADLAPSNMTLMTPCQNMWGFFSGFHKECPFWNSMMGPCWL